MNQAAHYSEGLLGLQQVADKLAEFGRHEDTYIVHAAEGETVIPTQVFESNPYLKESLFRQMRYMGLDPDRYIVGNELNSINPVTGQPEFFLKKIFKGLKKVVKKVAPVVLPVALSMVPALGPIYGGALGSGIGTLLSGGSTKDALKNSLISGGIGGLFSGLRGGFTRAPGQTFMSGFEQGISRDIMAPFNAARGLGSVPQEPPKTVTEDAAIRGDAATISADSFSDLQVGEAAMGTPDPNVLSYEPTFKLGEAAMGTPDPNVLYTPENVPQTFSSAGQGKLPFNLDSSAISPEFGVQPAVDAAVAPVAEGSRLERIGDYLRRGGKSPGDVAAAQSLARTDQVNKTLGQYGYTALDQAPVAVQRAAINAGEAAAKAAGPGLLQRYGPSLAIGAGVLGAAGAFKEPDEPEQVDFFEQRYGPQGTVTGAVDQFRSVVPAPYQPISLQDVRVPSRFAAKGGSIQNFPRRTGPISGPGTGTSDDVPAMLSDGEFVMTAKAVRGAGNGSRKQGMQNMYNMMRRFEAGA